MITFHADDYGINVEQSRRILRCRDLGVLNSVSIMPNSSHLDETVPLLDKDIKKSIHINLAEGKCCADAEDIPLLQKNGYFYRSFISFCLLSVFRGRELERESALEIEAQIHRVAARMDGGYRIRADSHIHYHMIPPICKGLCKALKQSGYDVEYIRWPAEKLRFYLQEPEVWRHMKAVNLVKILVLNVFSIINRKTLAAYGYESKTGLFYGVGFTGSMYKNRIMPVLLRYMECMDMENRSLEVLFHPGAIKKGEEYLKGSRKEFVDFYQSDNRRKEALALKGLKNDENIFSGRRNRFLPS